MIKTLWTTSCILNWNLKPAFLFMLHSTVVPPAVLKTFETLPGLYLVLSPELNVLTASDAYLDAARAHRQEIAGSFVADVVPKHLGGGMRCLAAGAEPGAGNKAAATGSV